MRSSVKAVCGLMLLGAVGGGVWYGLFGSAAAQLRRAERALQIHDVETAGRLARALLAGDPNNERARMILLEAAAAAGDADTEREHLLFLIEQDEDVDAVHRRRLAVLALLEHDATGAERWLKEVLKVKPGDATATSMLAEMFTRQGRRWEARPLLFHLLCEGAATFDQTLLLGRTEDMVPLTREEVVARYGDRSQPAPLIGLARFGMVTGDEKIAEELLRDVVRDRPDLVEAQVRLLEILQQREDEEFLTRLAQAPDAVEQHPAYWFVRGRWYRAKQEHAAAIGCLLHAVRLNPNHQVASFELAQLLAQLDARELSASFRERADRLEELHNELKDIYAERIYASGIQKISDLLLALGRDWESVAWARVAMEDRPVEWARERISSLQPGLQQGSPQTRRDTCPAEKIDLADWPVPAIQSPAPGTGRVADVPTRKQVPVSLVNRATDLGIDFTYFNGAVPGQPPKMYQFTGGGVGVIDFDLDSWPDLYLTTGTAWPPDPNQQEYRDRFYRSVAGTGFVDVSEPAGVEGVGFGQGLTVGDFDADGFPDLYVANIGRNQLLRNNGDGTFTDVTEQAGLTSAVWTTGCVIVDLNGDCLPDLFDLNFLTGDDVFERVCEELGVARGCHPADFPGEQDRVLLNQGDGRFVDVTDGSGIVRPLGNGLGIVAADFDGSGQINLFVANDSVPNFYYVNESEPGGAIRFEEAAILAGLDVSRQGQSQACMGVAVDDLNGNGLLDVFVTNFYQDSNSVYMQQSENIFIDEARATNIATISKSLLGFGTQFLDVELDGISDLVVTNGHVDDFSELGRPYKMRPQLLRRATKLPVRFEESRMTPPSEYFDSLHLGRGLARIDVDQNGLEDFVVSHLDKPVAVVMNETSDHGQFVSVQLIATASAREAVGARVHIQAADQACSRQLTVGDGYMASNERWLVFGLGDATQPCTVRVDWPSGHSEEHTNIPLGAHLTLTEGLEKPLPVVR